VFLPLSANERVLQTVMSEKVPAQPLCTERELLLHQWYSEHGRTSGRTEQGIKHWQAQEQWQQEGNVTASSRYNRVITRSRQPSRELCELPRR